MCQVCPVYSCWDLIIGSQVDLADSICETKLLRAIVVVNEDTKRFFFFW